MLSLTSQRPNAVHWTKARTETLPATAAPIRTSFKVIVVGLLLSAVVAVATGALYGERQEIQGRILFDTLPPNVASAHLLPTEDVKSLSVLMKSPESIESVIHDLGLPIAPAELERRLETKTPPGTPSIAVTLRWSGDGGEAVLNAVMDNFVSCVGELRKRTMNERLSSLQAALAISDRESDKARDELTEYYRSRGVADLGQEMRLLNLEFDSMSTVLANMRHNQTRGKAQLALLDRMIERINREEGIAAGSAVLSDLEAGSKQRHTHQRLQYMIQDERRLRSSEAKYAAKKKEYDREVALAAQNASSTAVVERVHGELLALEVEVKDNDQILEYKRGLSEPDASDKASPLQSAPAKKLEIELEQHGYEKNIEVMTDELKSKRSQIVTLQQLQASAAPLSNQVQRREAERSRLQGYVDQLKLLSDVGRRPASVLQSAAVSSTGSSKRGLLIAATFTCCFLGWLGLSHLGRTRFSERAGEESAKRLGLPLLGRIPDRRGTGSPMSTELRALTHLLRQRVPGAGAAILFTPIHGGRDLSHLLRDAAVCLASRDEKILILDAVIPTSEPTADDKKRNGLSDYLSHNDIEPNSVILKSEVDGVDFLAAGTAVVPPDALATQRMRQLIDHVRGQYTLILVMGHSALATTDVQIMAGYMEAVVLVIDTPAGLRRDAVDAIRTHLDAGVPLLGCVRVANE